MMMADLVIDLQFGSTGKGLLCGYLAEQNRYDTVVAAWGPNAGHTYINGEGKRCIVTMLPVGAHFPWCKSVLIGPGAVVNLDALRAECDHAYDVFGATFELYIHPAAVRLEPRHSQAEREGSNITIGSTMKGMGAAVIEKIQRDATRPPLMRDAVFDFDDFPCDVHVSEDLYDFKLDQACSVLIEGAQGYSLGIHRSRFWPYTTSREVTVAQVLSDCAIPWKDARQVRVIGTARTFPIRVANRFNEAGEQVGTSGPVYPDQRELQWEELGIEPELTTVTKLPRRIFTFSLEQMRQAVRANGVHFIFLNFANYATENELDSIRERVRQSGAVVAWTGWGPRSTDIVEE